jgi:hypothetical protein
MVWKRTGKITLRSEPYLIMRFSTGYTALYGPQCERVTIGIYPDAEAAKTACEAHSLAIGEKIPERHDTVPG